MDAVTPPWYSVVGPGSSPGAVSNLAAKGGAAKQNTACIARACSAKLASTQKTGFPGRVVFVSCPQARTASREIGLDYDQLVSGRTIYTYVNGNPVSLVDPLGLEAEMCFRPIQGYIIPGQHCFVRFNGDDNNTSSFTPNGVGPDASPKGATCEKAKGPNDDDCVKREMKKCQDYGFLKNNCCHCAEQALKACGQSVPPKKWPNYPINPGPQPGEPGYKR